MNEFSKEYVCPKCGGIVWKKGPELSIVDAVAKGRSYF